MFRRLLTCTDGSLRSDEAVAAAVELAALSNDAGLFVLRVVPRRAASWREGAQPVYLARRDRIEQRWID